MKAATAYGFLMLLVLFCSFFCAPAGADPTPMMPEDALGGRIIAVRTLHDTPPKIDGNFADWDLSQMQFAWFSLETVSGHNVAIAMMYDSDALYLAARVGLPDRPLYNTRNPGSDFWSGDAFKINLVTDPAFPWPINPDDPAFQKSNRLLGCSFWKNTNTGVDYLYLEGVSRVPYKNQEFASEGGQTKGGDAHAPQFIVKGGDSFYTLEARLPWALLNVPGGKNPFAAGKKMTALFQTFSSEMHLPALYHNPPPLADLSYVHTRLPSYGQIEFAGAGTPSSDPTLLQIARGDQAWFGGNAEAALDAYQAIYQAVKKRKDVPQQVRLLAERRYLMFLLLRPQQVGRTNLKTWAFQLLNDSAASEERRGFGSLVARRLVGRVPSLPQLKTFAAELLNDRTAAVDSRHFGFLLARRLGKVANVPQLQTFAYELRNDTAASEGRRALGALVVGRLGAGINLGEVKRQARTFALGLLNDSTASRSRRRLGAFVVRRLGGAVPSRQNLQQFALRMLNDQQASPHRRLLGFTLAKRLFEGDTARLEASAQRILVGIPSRGPEGLDLRADATRVYAGREAPRAQEAMVQGYLAEVGARPKEAVASYEMAARIAQSYRADPSLEKIYANARKSVVLMRSLERLQASGAAAEPTCAFLGMDPTLGGDWYGSLGSEAWVLCGFYGNDICGGARLVDGSFSYRVRNGDPANYVRHWRDRRGYPYRPMADLVLDDPVSPQREVISFWDDNGETYPGHTGPDLYVDLTIPAGAHLLSLPLHYSAPGWEDAHYGFYLFDSLQKTQPPVCRAARIVSVAECPGYLRARVTGPARYTLVVRRLNSLNANVQGLFLDPDPSGEEAATMDLRAGFSAQELRLAGVDGDSLSLGSESEINLWRMVVDYSALVKKRRENSGWTEQASASWARLADRALPLAFDPKLTDLQRSAAAWMAWRATERGSLQAGKEAIAFGQYLATRYVPRQNASFDAGTGATKDSTQDPARVAELRAMAKRLRDENRLKLAELAEDLAWKRDPVLAGPPAELLSPDALTRAENHLQKLWEETMRPYLEYRPFWIWLGEEASKPQELSIAADIQYASQKARQISLWWCGAKPPQFGSARAHYAREWVDALDPAREHSADKTTVKTASQETSNTWKAFSEAAVGRRVYIAACEPLLGQMAPSLPASLRALPEMQTLRLNREMRLAQLQTNAGKKENKVVSQAESPAIPAFPCVLRTDQLYSLGLAWMSQDAIQADQQGQSVGYAALLLRALRTTYPDSEEAGRVPALLKLMPPRLLPPEAQR